jgi:type II secretory pathway pseudopilin PulG
MRNQRRYFISAEGYRGCSIPNVHRRAFTIAETALATLIVGLLVVGSLKSLSASFQTHKFSENRVRALLLAEQLLIELSSLSWFDPNKPSSATTIGKDTGDTTTVTRRDQLDDMDDYHNWSEQPRSRSGVALTGTSTMTRTVTVENISATDPTVEVAGNVNTGIRRLTVIVTENGTELARLSTLLTSAENGLRAGVFEQPSVPNAVIH